jgi:hypothetical protein
MLHEIDHEFSYVLLQTSDINFKKTQCLSPKTSTFQNITYSNKVNKNKQLFLRKMFLYPCY